METMHLHVAQDPRQVAHRFADFLLELSQKADRLSIALSGGSTPQLLFDILAAEYKTKIDWNKIHFYWGDERCVAPDHADSNYGMTKRHLFDHVEVPQGNIHRILGENAPKTEAVRHSREIADNLPQVNSLPQFDLVMLGLGTDGHTASIFPHQMELLDANDICVEATHPDSGQKRISLSGPVINNARFVAFLVTGESKRRKVDEIINKKGDWKTYPASYISPTSGELHWFLDEAARGVISPL